MVEQRSSKSLTWVRFLLSLFLYFTKSKKQKPFNKKKQNSSLFFRKTTSKYKLLTRFSFFRNSSPLKSNLFFSRDSSLLKFYLRMCRKPRKLHKNKHSASSLLFKKDFSKFFLGKHSGTSRSFKKFTWDGNAIVFNKFRSSSVSHEYSDFVHRDVNYALPSIYLNTNSEAQLPFFYISFFIKNFSFLSCAIPSQPLNLDLRNEYLLHFDNININSSFINSLTTSKHLQPTKFSLANSVNSLVKVNSKDFNKSFWSDFQNSLFYSKSYNTSARALFTSVSFYTHTYFLQTPTLFADIKSGNNYLNTIFAYDNVFQNGFFNSVKTLFFLTNRFNFSGINTPRGLTNCSVAPFRESSFHFSNFFKKNFYNLRIKTHYLFLQLRKSTKFISPKNKSKKFKKNILKGVLRSLIKTFKKRGRRLRFLLKNFKYSSRTNFRTLKRLSSRRKNRFFKIKSLNTCVFDFSKYCQASPSINARHMSRPKLLHNDSVVNYNFTSFFTASNKFCTSKIFNLSNILLDPFHLKFYMYSQIAGFSNFFYRTEIFLFHFFKNILSTTNAKFNVTDIDLISRNSNLFPNHSFNRSYFKKISGSFADGIFTTSSTPWHFNSIIRFFEFCSGRKVLFQFYPFLFQSVEKYYVVLYKRWMLRMSYYERNLGHKFFLEEALHLIHLSLNLHDPKIMLSWMKAMIKRISFWKTRSIFRFIRYLFRDYFYFTLNDVGAKGIKICLRGKISAAGNSRTRTILFRFGKNSHGNTSLKVLNEFTTIGTFTGVLGFQIWIFY